MKYNRFIPPILINYDQQCLVKLPWLWETKVHFVALYAGLLNILVLGLTCCYFLIDSVYHVHNLISISLGVVSFVGFGTWIYHLSRFNLEEGFGYKSDLIIKKRFLIYWLCILLFILPASIPNLISLVIKGHFESASFLSMSILVGSFIATMLLDIWKQVRNRQFIQTIIINALTFTGLIVLMDISLFFAVSLILISLFTLPILISSLGSMKETREYSIWKVIGVASFQFLSPFLLMLAFCLVLIPLSLIGQTFFMTMGSISCYCYFTYLLPKFSSIHAHFHALPRIK